MWHCDYYTIIEHAHVVTIISTVYICLVVIEQTGYHTHMHMHTHTHIIMCTHSGLHTHTYAHTHTHTHTHTVMWTHIQTTEHACMHTRLPACKCISSISRYSHYVTVTAMNRQCLCYEIKLSITVTATWRWSGPQTRRLIVSGCWIFRFGLKFLMYFR